MRTFFYSIRASNCTLGCDWKNCPERYYSQLKAANQEYDLSKLDDMVHTKVPYYPRWGDVIILFVSKQTDMDKFLSQKERFEGLKRIMVVTDPNRIKIEQCHKFRPSFITNTSRDLHEVTSVIDHIKRTSVEYIKGA